LKATAIIPVKRYGAAKQRLGTGMDDERRRAVVAAMLDDVLEAAGSARMVERVIVVTGEPGAAEAAAAAGAEVVEDPDDAGHREAALLGVERALELGAGCVVMLPGDCPLLDPRELDQLLTGVPDNYVAIVPDRHGTGTNALVLAPPGIIHPAFGEGSCARHVELAREQDIAYSVEELPSLGLDLDTPADIIALTRALEAGRGLAPHTAREMGI
jgi:2-phospho-L-lactate guanylyltransferase